MPDGLLIADLCFFSDDGHNHYRVHAPARALARLDGVTVVDCDLYHRGVPWLAAEADVLVLHGLNPEWHPVVQARRSRGQVTLFEASDNYLDIQPWSAYSAGWLDRSLQDLLWQTVAAADAVQTSTEALAGVWAGQARQVLVFPNLVGEVPPLRPPPVRPLTVGWAGSGTHLADWAAVAPAVARWVAGHRTARLAVMTDERARGLVRLPAERYDFRPPGSLAAYSRFLAGLDVGVVPLLPGLFNHGRTDLKFVDYAAAGVAGVYPRRGPYTAVEDGRTGLLYDTPEELVGCLDRLAADGELRARVRAAAHEAVTRRRAADDPGLRARAYRELLGRPGRCPELPTDLRAVAVADGRYLRLEPGPPERALAAAVKAPASEAVASALARLVAEFPAYTAAARQLSRVLNDLGRHAEARPVAERVAAAVPDSPGSRIELARALLGVGRRDEARYQLELAVVANPRHPVTWQLLTQLADRADEARRVAGLWAGNAPGQYMPAIGRLATLPPGEAVAALGELVVRFVPSLHPEERPYASAALAQAAASLLDAVSPADFEPVLAGLAAAFPESARLADLHGECLYRSGRVAESDEAFARAGHLNRIAVTTQLDAEACGPRVWRWQVAEYARRNRAGGTP